MIKTPIIVNYTKQFLRTCNVKQDSASHFFKLLGGMKII